MLQMTPDAPRSPACEGMWQSPASATSTVADLPVMDLPSDIPWERQESCSVSPDPEDLYEALLGPSLNGTPTAIFCWWPSSSNWTFEDLVESCTSCLPAVRPGLDLVALPSLPEVHDLWETWTAQHGVRPGQAIWFSPRFGADAVEDPALAAGVEIMDALKGMRAGPRPAPVLLQDVRLCPAHASDELLQEAAARGVPVVYDPSDATGPLRSPLADGCRRSGQPHSLPVRLWASRSVHPVALVGAECLALTGGGPNVKDIMGALRLQDLVWDGDEGVIVYQCTPRGRISFIIASSFGSCAVEIMQSKLRVLMKSFGLDML